MSSQASSVVARKLEDVFLFLLQRCSSMGGMKRIHALVIKLSMSQSNFLATQMLDLCDKNSEVHYANLLFKHMPEPNIFVYNAMVRTCAHSHVYALVITVYKELLRRPNGKNSALPNGYTFPFVVKSCVGILCDRLGRQVHGHVCKFGPKDNIATQNSLIDMYARFDYLAEAGKVFDEMSDRDPISWNCLISVHLKVGQVEKASEMFEEMPEKTVVSWTTLITGYAKNGSYAKALDVFRQMQMAGLSPDVVCLVAVLPACSQLGALELGKWIHFYANKNGFLQSTYLCNALIEMYANCGCINEAIQLFDQMPHRDVISWSTIIGALANHGRAREAIELFHRMQEDEVAPNNITFLGLLTACAHAGFFDEGRSYFDMMRDEYHIEPEREHYCCLVDILGRAGHLDRALHLLTNIPVKPDVATWASLLSSCRTHRNLEIASIAMEHLQELDPSDTGNYILFANIYADCGEWGSVSDIRRFIKSNRMKKTPGCSLIEVNNRVVEFASGAEIGPCPWCVVSVLELLAWHLTSSMILGEDDEY